MNPFAYRTTGLAVKALAGLSKARIYIHGAENIPQGSKIFVINHFTRIETLFMPYHIHRIIGIPVWSLADYELFKGSLGAFLDQVGAVSTRNPDRDRLIVKTLLTGEAAWIIFPEGRMVKSKKIFEKGRFMISHAGGRHPPHTGAATLALRSEFYRERMRIMNLDAPEEAERLKGLFRIESLVPVLSGNTFVVPVNATYYPLRARENILSDLAARFVEGLPERFLEEIMTEGTMLLSGVDVDIRFGQAIEIKSFINNKAILGDVRARRPIGFNDPIACRPEMRKAALEIMQRYMSAIYDMTTVNHDHLFASMVRSMPFKRIDERDLRRRVFWVASSDIDDTGVHLHRSLDQQQVHLLADDRFGRFGDFVAVARDKNVLKKEGRFLVKDASSFFPRFDFHRIRIENPVAVMANEVEPLVRLQRRIRRVAWMPGFWLKRIIAKYLHRQAVAEFKKDYHKFFDPTASKPEDVGMPFLVKGKTRDMGVLLIHGYMAAPREVKELAEYLGRSGLWVYVPRLKGHGTSPDDLAAARYQDWMLSVDSGYAVLSSICKRIVVGGFSAGGGLALDAAVRIPDVEGVFAVCPPLRLRDFSSKFVPAVDAWNRLMEKIRLAGAKKEFVENQPENPHINYLRNPVSGILELERFMESLEERLTEIQVPALIVQSQGDPVVSPKGSKRVYDLLGSADKTYQLFNFDRHGILLGKGAERVHEAVLGFVLGLKQP